MVPGCSRTDSSGTDYCVDPGKEGCLGSQVARKRVLGLTCFALSPLADLNKQPTRPTAPAPVRTPTKAPAPTPSSSSALFSYGSNPPSDVFPLGVCEGDCDDDGDCDGDLICYQRDSGSVPGCSGTPSGNLDYCIRKNTSPVPAPAPTPPTSPVPSSGLQNFKLKMYWEPGFFWQEESIERKWCMRCRGGSCSVGEKLYIENCDYDVQRFDFSNVSNDEVLIKLNGTNRCLERLGQDIYVRDCDSGKSLQRWWAKVGGFTEGRFELSQKSATNLCVTQRHHPKPDEEVELEPCTTARISDTSFWMRY